MDVNEELLPVVVWMVWKPNEQVIEADVGWPEAGGNLSALNENPSDPNKKRHQTGNL